MKKYIIVVFFMFFVNAYAKHYSCHEYPSFSYVLTHKPNALNPNAKDITKIVNTTNYRLLLVTPKKDTHGHERYLFLLDKNGKKVANSYHSCPSRRLHTNRLYCYGECDSGIFSIEPDKSINFKTKGVTLGDEDVWDIEPKHSADLPKPSKVTCPKSIESIDIAPDSNTKEYRDGIKTEYKRLEKPARYVCYVSKKIVDNKIHYIGCRYTRDSCSNYYGGFKHFGKYVTQKETLNAFNRCRNSISNVSKKANHKTLIKRLSKHKIYRYNTPLSSFGLSGINKQSSSYTDARRYTKLPRGYEKIDILDKMQEGWIALSRDADNVVYANQKHEIFWNIHFRDIVREKRYVIDDIRYENDILYFNASCISYAKEQKNKCSTLYAYDTKNRRLLWHSKYLTSRNIFILTDKFVIAGYGFTAEDDYLYILRKTDGKVLKKIELDSALYYLEIKDDKLHVITYNNHYVFRINI